MYPEGVQFKEREIERGKERERECVCMCVYVRACDRKGELWALKSSGLSASCCSQGAGGARSAGVRLLYFS